jgi:hypothetical protein
MSYCKGRGSLLSMEAIAQQGDRKFASMNMHERKQTATICIFVPELRSIAFAQTHEVFAFFIFCANLRALPLITVWLQVRVLPGPPMYAFA